MSDVCSQDMHILFLCSRHVVSVLVFKSQILMSLLLRRDLKSVQSLMKKLESSQMPPDHPDAELSKQFCKVGYGSFFIFAVDLLLQT